MAPRIDPLARDEMSEDALQLMAESVVPDTVAFNIFATFVKHPGLFRRWIPYCAKLLVAGKIPERDREILILRTAYRWGAAYEWGQHALVAAACGMSEEEIARVAEAADAPGWTPFERALISAVDDIRDDGVISETSWSVLASLYSEKQLIEIPFLLGAYSSVAWFLRSVGVEPEPGLPPMPSSQR